MTELTDALWDMARLMNRCAKETGSLDNFEEYLLLRDAREAHANRVEEILRERTNVHSD